MSIKVLMLPNEEGFGNEQSGIRRVVEAYYKYLPAFGVEFMHPDSENYDILAVHAGMTGAECDVAHTHGLYWTADYDADSWEFKVNARVIEACRHAKVITVPSNWVAETFRRDMRIDPYIVPHGIDWEDWQHNRPMDDYILWNKNRVGDVCDPAPMVLLARKFPKRRFVTTFIGKGIQKPNNMNVIASIIPHDQMKLLVQSSLVYLSTTKETFGIGVLEAMAAGVPVLGTAEGGNLELVEHGINGYLVEPGNLEDLAEGLDYCIRHRKTLGKNGIELAKKWSWEKACEILLGAYEEAMEYEGPRAAIVIPVYNKSAAQVTRAIESALKQSYIDLSEIIVVDDGSENHTELAEAVSSCGERDGRVKLVRQYNGGVAIARNRGIAESDTKYVCCLDADDAIKPTFLEVCIRELEADRSLGIAYTGLHYIKPNGEEGLSPWPTAFDYDKQLKRANQIPTCCVFRKSMWERLGGYRQRYAPKGAGEEDAEFWLRAGAAGFGAKKVTEHGLFVYSWLSGLVSGNKDHPISNYTVWHPWARGNGKRKHPFASLATPERLSHPVRQYDNPIVSVVIPVGPGHEKHVINALDSLEAQDFHKWQAVLVWDGADPDLLDDIAIQYPYAHIVQVEDSVGAGAARNLGVKLGPPTPFLLFLDADDWLYPTFLQRVIDTWNTTKQIVYTDYVGKAFVDNPDMLDPVLQERMYQFNTRTKEAIIGYKAADYDCKRAQQQPEGSRPFIWCNVTSLIPRVWFDEVDGFDETLESWEDVDLHWRLARKGKCYLRIPEELMVYCFHKGNRRETGIEFHTELIQYLLDKYETEEIMACSGCGGKRRAARSTVDPKRKPATVQATSDDFVLIKYMHPNKGKHPVVGTYKFTSPVEGVTNTRLGANYQIKYGPHMGNGKETFLVHRMDMQSMPAVFVEVKEFVPVEVPKAVVPAPTPVNGPVEQKVEQIIDLQAIPGVGPVLAAKLERDGIRSKEDVIQLGVEGLSRYKLVTRAKAEIMIDLLTSGKIAV